MTERMPGLPAAGLPDEWTAVLKDEDAVDGPPGAGTALVMFAALSDEISMTDRRQAALTFVSASVATYPGNLIPGRKLSSCSRWRNVRLKLMEAAAASNCC